jgi:hypothetical protein
VDDDVAGVDQHPVAVGQALDAGAAVTGILERAQQVIGHRPDVALRTAGRDDHPVGDGAFVLEVDEDDVLGFLVVQAIEKEALKSPGGRVDL